MDACHPHRQEHRPERAMQVNREESIAGTHVISVGICEQATQAGVDMGHASRIGRGPCKQKGA